MTKACFATSNNIFADTFRQSTCFLDTPGSHQSDLATQLGLDFSGYVVWVPRGNCNCPLWVEVIQQSQGNIAECVELLLRVWLTGVVDVELKRRDVVQKLGVLSRCDLSVDFLQSFLSCDPLKVSEGDDCLVVTHVVRRFALFCDPVEKCKCLFVVLFAAICFLSL